MGVELEDFIGPAIGAGAEIAGAAIDRGATADANKINRQIAQENRDWQERMSNTSYQRQVADLQAAGLNVANAYGSSSGASTPTGSTTRVEPLAIGGGVSKAISTAMDIQQRKALIDNTRANTEKATQEGRTAKAEADYWNDTDVASNRLMQSDAALDITLYDRDIRSLTKEMSKMEKETFRKQLDAVIAGIEQTNKVSHEQAREIASRALLLELQEPGARNEANFQRSFAGRAMPYVGAARDVMGLNPMIGGIKGIVNKFFRGKLPGSSGYKTRGLTGQNPY